MGVCLSVVFSRSLSSQRCLCLSDISLFVYFFSHSIVVLGLYDTLIIFVHNKNNNNNSHFRGGVFLFYICICIFFMLKF